MRSMAWILIFAPLFVLAAEAGLYQERSKKTVVPVFQIAGVHLSDSPSCRATKCRAAMIANKKATRVLSKASSKKIDSRFEPSFNPAQDSCKSFGGSLDTYFEDDLSEVSVCVFADSSFIFSWDLVNKSMPARK